MLFNNRYDTVKPFYKYLNILPLAENIKLLQGKLLQKLLARLYLFHTTVAPKRSQLLLTVFLLLKKGFNISDYSAFDCFLFFCQFNISYILHYFVFCLILSCFCIFVFMEVSPNPFCKKVS